MATRDRFTDPCLNLGAETIASCYVPTLPSESAFVWPTVTWNGISNETGASTTVPSSPSAALTLPLAAGTWTNCPHYVRYMDVPADASYLELANPNYCLMRAALWGIELEQLLWNPSLPEMVNETMLDYCMLEEGFSTALTSAAARSPQDQAQRRHRVRHQRCPLPAFHRRRQALRLFPHLTVTASSALAQVATRVFVISAVTLVGVHHHALAQRPEHPLRLQPS